MSIEQIDFDKDELHDVVLEMATKLEETFKSYEKTHGLNFAGSLCATLAMEMLVRLALTSPSMESALEAWSRVTESANKALNDRAMHQFLMQKYSAKKSDWNKK